MECEKCGYNRLVAERCASCGTYIGTRGMGEEYLVDYFRKIKINNSNIYIFPTVLGNDKSFGHWTKEINVDSFLKHENDQNSMIGHSIDVIVNSSNNYLIPGSGLAKYLRAKLSVDYSFGCESLLENRTLKKGESYFISIPKQFRIKAGIIEAITIEYEKAENGLNRVLSNTRDVYNCVYSSLELCDKKGYRSIAFPQMASRVGYSIYSENPSKKMIASTYLAINDYLESVNSKIEEIYIHPSNLESEELLLILFDNKTQFRTV